MYRYQVYGLLVDSAMPIPELPSAWDGPDCDLLIRWEHEIQDEPPPGYSLLRTSRERRADDSPLAVLYQASGCCLLRYTGIADFELGQDASYVVVRCHPSAPLSRVRLILVGSILSLVLERMGIPCLHASAIAWAGKAVAFLGETQTGKSWLAALFLQAGASLISDDIVPVRSSPGMAWLLPGFPQMRMWPDAAHYFLADSLKLEPVDPSLAKLRVPIRAGFFGAFCSQPQSLLCLYLPQRSPESGWEQPLLAFQPVPPAQAVVELVKGSFIGPLVDLVGPPTRRIEALATLVEQVPIRRFTYPSGVQHLPRIRDAILADMEWVAAHGHTPPAILADR